MSSRSPGGPLLLHLGGGKPLGLGSCTATVSGLRVWTAASRYGGAPETPGRGRLSRARSRPACPAEVNDATWPALAAVLAEGTVNAARVWYPPGAYWPDAALSDQKTFDEPFAFFTASSGMPLAHTGKQREPDPAARPATRDQSLPIVRRGRT